MIRYLRKYAVMFAILLMLAGSLLYTRQDAAVMESPQRIAAIMYHSVVKNISKAGKYAVSLERLENDLKYLKENGYQSVTAFEVAEAVRLNKKIPEKAVMITFDDGYYNVLLYALPLLEKYDMKAVVSVVGSYTDTYDNSDDRNPVYAYLGSEDIKKLLDSGRIEIANHSYNMHRQSPRHGTKQINGENDNKYYQSFCDDTEKCKKLVWDRCGCAMTTYTYPYGQITPKSEKYLEEMGYTAILTCYERINVLSTDDSVLSLGRFNRDGTLKTDDFMRKCGIK